MLRPSSRFDVPLTAMRRASSTFLSLLLLSTPIAVLAHGGHGNEFQGGSQAAHAEGAIQVDAETAKRMGLKIEPVSRQQLAFGIKATGQIEALPNQQVEVTTPVGGTVLRLLVKPGETVSVGQAVAVMTSSELAELRTTALDRRSDAIGSTQQADADLRLAQQNYAQQQKIAATDTQQARTELSFSQERYNQDKELLAKGAIPRRTVLESETKLAQARAALTKAESRLQVSEAAAQLKRSQAGVEVAQSKVALSGQTYQTRLRQLGASANEDGTLTITAPIAGVVADRETTTGESGQDAGKKIMTIVNGRSVQVSANIYEKDLSQVQPGQRVRVKVNGIPDRTFEGRISVIGAVVQGETRVVPVKAELDNPGGVLKPGMFAALEVLTRAPVSVLAVPKAAIVETTDKKQVVFVQNGTAFQPTEITPGRASGNFVEVKSGLFDGDLIVTQRANQLYAQSLRGNTNAEAGATGEKAPPVAATQEGQLPWWMVVPIGGAIAVSTFFAGIYWATRKSRDRMMPVSNLEPNGYQTETEFYLDPSKHSNGAQAAKAAETQQTPQQPE